MSTPPRDPKTAEALARLYDVDLLEDQGDLDLYLALAARTGGPILEIASGTGRIALPLAEAGYEVTAIDIDPAMVARAEKGATAAGPASRQRLKIVRSDLVDLALPGGPRFRLAILALNSILLLETRERQRQALETMARHLAPGGLAVVDAWIPSADELARYDGRTALEYVRTDPEGGLMVTKVTAAVHEPAAGQVELTAIYEEGDQGAPPRRWVRQDRLRLLDADELRSLAEAAGLEIEALAGDYDLSPVGAHDERVILVARRRESPAARP